MFAKAKAENSQEQLIEVIRKTNKSGLLRNTMKSPREILDFIESGGESISSLAKKAKITEREFLLAILDENDIETRRKIADILNITYYTIFGK